MSKTIAGLLSLALLTPSQLTPHTVNPLPKSEAKAAQAPSKVFLPMVFGRANSFSLGNPTVIQRTPNWGEEIGAGGVEFVFDRAMNRASVEAALKVEPNVAGEMLWQDDHTFIFKPSAALSKGTALVVMIGSEARAQDGLPLRDRVQHRVQVADDLKVLQVIPADNTTDITPEADNVITVMFNRPVVPLALSGNLPQPLSFEPPLAGKQVWLNTATLVFYPSTALPAGQRFTARVAAIADVQGAAMAQPFTWSFSTAPPKVLNITVNNPIDYYSPDDAKALEASISVLFSQPVDEASAHAAFGLRKVGGEAVAGSFTVAGASLLFTPTQWLTIASTYEVRIAAGVRGIGGGIGSSEGTNQRFNTAPLPRLTNTFPANGATNVRPNEAFILGFNTPVRVSDVISNVTFSPALSLTGVNYQAETPLVYLPVRLKPNTNYTVNIRAGIADRYGNRTQTPTTLQFSTGDYSPQNPSQHPLIKFEEVYGTFVMLNTVMPAIAKVRSVNVTRLNLTLWQISRANVETTLNDAANGGNAWRSGATAQRQWTHTLNTPQNELTVSSLNLAAGNETLAAGLYALEVNAPETNQPNEVMLLMVSPYHLTLKIEDNRMTVWANDVASGQPVVNLPLVYLGTRVATNDDGIAIFNNPPNNEGKLVLSGSEAALAAVSNDWRVSAANIGGNTDTTTHLSGLRVYLYTDRSIYRPGHTVQLRAIVRNENDARYSLPPANTIIPIVVYASQDTNNGPAYELMLTTDANGVASASIPLKATALTGQYRFTLRWTESRPINFSASGFTVVAYRPVEHEVTFPTPLSNTVLGDTAAVVAQARYLFGAAMRNTAVTWRLTASPTFFRPDGFDAFTFSDDSSPYGFWWDWWQPAPSAQLIASGSANTDDSGRATIRAPITRTASTVTVGGNGPLAMTFEASATDPSAQTVAGEMQFVAHPARHYVGMALTSWMLTTGQSNPLDVVAVDWAGNRVAGKAIEINLYRREWQVSPTSGLYEPNDELIHSQNISSQSGPLRVNLPIPATGGMFRIVASSRDEQGRLAQSVLFSWSVGANERWFTGDKVAKLQLVPNKTEFAPGETASILIPSPYKSPDDGNQYALITLERGRVYEQVVRRITGSSLTYELPITGDHAPNIFVSVLVFKGKGSGQVFAAPALVAGTVNLRVKPSKQTLNISIRGSQLTAAPGDEVEYTLQVRNADGAPVSGQFSLDMVDKGVLNLKPRKEGEPLDAFYTARGQRVRTAASSVVSWDDTAKMPLSPTTTPDPLAPSVLPTPNVAAPVRENADTNSTNANAVRSNFQDTGYWNPLISTDGEGIAKVVIRLADNLTTWVLRAVGADTQTRVGEGTTQLVTSKPLLIQPITPRFMVEGDQVSLGATVQNTTNTPLTATVWLREFGGLRLNSTMTQTVGVPANGNATVRWSVTVLAAAQADLIFAAQAQVNGATFADATRPRLSTAPNGGIRILHYSTPETVGTAGVLGQAGSRTEYVVLPPKWSELPLAGSLDVRLEPSLAAAVQNALTALDYTRYGFKDCVECVLSELIPNVMHFAALREFNQINPSLEAKLRGLIAERLRQLYAMQNNDGGFGWRYYGQWHSNPHVTAYAVFGMVRAKAAGFDINANTLNRAIEYLQAEVQPLDQLSETWRVNAQPYLAYVLAEAGQAPSGSISAIYNQRSKLDLHGLALLTLAVGRANGKDARLQTLFAELNARAVNSATGTHWENRTVCYWCMSSHTHATALVLSALARHDPNNQMAANAVRWLMSNRLNNNTGAWNSSYETAWALIGLMDWLRATQEQKGNYAYGAQINNTRLLQGTVNASNVITPLMASVTIASLDPSTPNLLQIERGAGDGRLYYTAHLVAGVSASAVRASNRGIGVQRRFTAANCTDGDRCAELREVKVGDLLRVQVSVLANSDLYHVEINDTLPAGMEIVDPELSITPKADVGMVSVSTLLPWWWWRWQWYTSQQFRDDRVTLFAPSLGRGSYHYTYVVRATVPGEFNVIPAIAQERYFPEVYGRSDGALVRVLP